MLNSHLIPQQIRHLHNGHSPLVDNGTGMGQLPEEHPPTQTEQPVGHSLQRHTQTLRIPTHSLAHHHQRTQVDTRNTTMDSSRLTHHQRNHTLEGTPQLV